MAPQCYPETFELLFLERRQVCEQIRDFRRANETEAFDELIGYATERPFEVDPVELNQRRKNGRDVLAQPLRNPRLDKRSTVAVERGVIVNKVDLGAKRVVAADETRDQRTTPPNAAGFEIEGIGIVGQDRSCAPLYF